MNVFIKEEASLLLGRRRVPMKPLGFECAEEIFSTYEFPQTIKANDRATMLNLMMGLNGYTLCSGIICEELNGYEYKAVPLEPSQNGVMEIGYITRKNHVPSRIASLYIEKIRNYLEKS